MSIVEYEENMREEVKVLIRKARMMDCESAEALKVSQKTVERWRKGKVLPCLVAYMRLRELSNNALGPAAA